MIETVLEYFETLPQSVTTVIIGIIAGLVLKFILFQVTRIAVRYYDNLTYRDVKSHLGPTTTFFIPVLVTYLILLFAPFGDSLYYYMNKLFQVFTIILGSLFLINLLKLFQTVILNIYDIDKADNKRERRIITQTNFVKRLLVALIIIIAISLILLSFEGGRKIGTALITSAGVAGLIIGLAAQKSIGNFIAGFQIAFTQPIKIDDALLVEGEWGKVEEINLTYVVVKIWDLRRLILPITYFLEKPFQNWTKNEANLLGAVYLYLDYRIPVEKVRSKLKEILDHEKLWDGDGWGLQVVDANESTVALRGLMSAKNAPEAWELRCSVREKLFKFLAEEYPEYLPHSRVRLRRAENFEGGFLDGNGGS